MSDYGDDEMPIEMMTGCSDEDLELFSNKHYTYINQIFGDATVREIITEVFPNQYEFGVEETGIEFENSFHHIVKNRQTGDVICSVNAGIQNIFINKNDTLCQSYSLLNYFGIPISKNPKRRQMAMIKMYREKLLSNAAFIAALDDVIYKGNRVWLDYTKPQKGNRKNWMVMDKKKILEKIHEILDEWEQYGYWFFIGDGKCPKSLSEMDKLSEESSLASSNESSTSYVSSQSSSVASVASSAEAKAAPEVVFAATPTIIQRKKGTKKKPQYSKYLKSKKTRGKTQRRKTHRRGH